VRTWELQRAIVDRLADDAAVMAIATGVFDHVPQGATFPYVVIGDDLASAVDTDDTLNADHVVTVHTWSRYRGQKETKQLQQAVYAALHRGALTVASAVYVDCQAETQESFLDDDGLTRHGVQRFRVLLDEVTP
jgi:hypothetical protein